MFAGQEAGWWGVLAQIRKRRAMYCGGIRDANVWDPILGSQNLE
jgi:hypothetical protein